MRQETKEKLQGILEQAIADGELAGGSLLVRKDGQELCYLESGMADREAGVPVSRDRIYRLYSMSKPVTGAAAMKLFEDGKLDLGEPVSRFLPSYKNQQVEEDGKLVPVAREMTVKNLLDMTSGLVYEGEGSAAEKYTAGVFTRLQERLKTDHPMTTVELASRLGEGPLAFQPGSCFRYGTSADVLGAVIEVVSGMRFGAYLEKEFFGPLGMKDTGFWVPQEKRDRLVKVYQADGKGGLKLYSENHLGIMNFMDRPAAYEAGGAGLVSTVDDYARFGQMLLNGGELDGKRILGENTVKYMTNGMLTCAQQAGFDENFSNMPGFTYGNLVRVMAHPGRSSSINSPGEYGWDGWLGCYFANDPVEKMTMLFMTQRTDAGLMPVVRRLRNVIMSEI